MSGTQIAWYLLKTNSGLTAQVPAARIKCGILPLNTLLPAISILQVDASPRLLVNPNAAEKLITERVQVTVEASTYATQKSILELVRDALPNMRGTVNGFAVDSIVPDSEGPDIFDQDLTAYVQSQDFIIKYLR